MESHRAAAAPAEPLLKMEDVSLSYGHVKALSRIRLSISPSHVHAVVGEHGAGKSTLARVLCGLARPDSGRITFGGASFGALTAEKARAVGIEMVFQEMQVLGFLRVVDVFHLRQAKWRLVPLPEFIRLKRQAEEVERFLEACGYPLDPYAFLKDLGRSEQLMVEILKSLFHEPRLLILDEVFERLSALDLEKVVRLLRRMRQDGMSVVLITHRVDDIYEHADRVSVLKNGEVMLTTGVGNIDKMNLIKLTYTQISREEHRRGIGQEFYQSLRYNEAILQSLPMIVLVVDGEHRVKVANEFAQRFFGTDRRGLIDRPIHELFSSASAADGSRIRRALGSRQKKVFYGVPLEANGRRTINNVVVYPIADGTFIIGRIVIVEDLTEHEKMRGQLLLSEKLASVGLLAAGVAHEINNPLGIITNYLQSIRFRYPEAELGEKLSRIGDQVSSISTIVSNLLSFSDSGRTAAEEVDLDGLVREMIELIRYGASRNGITVRFHGCREPLPLKLNRNELKQVVLNLFKNSFEAMPGGGEVELTTGRARDKDGDWVLLKFRDNGPGIQHENPADVFLPFSSTKKNGQGNLGLGLYVSYGIIQKYRGEIAAENLEAGCLFTIRLPRAKVRGA